MMRYLPAIVCAVTLVSAAVASSYGEAARTGSDAQFAGKVEEARGMVDAGIQRDKKLSVAGPQGPSKVEITSFVFVGPRTQAAEICGKVTGSTSTMPIVRLTVDPKSDRPGAYTVLAGKDGLFCAVVATYTGAADASLVDQGTASASATAASLGHRGFEAFARGQRDSSIR